MDLRDIKGIGPKRLELLACLGIRCAEDALMYFPSDYIDGTSITPLSKLTDGRRATVAVRVIGQPSVFYKGKMSIASVRCADETGKLTVRWYNQPYRAAQIHLGERLTITGRAIKNKSLSMANPVMSATEGCITPIYSVVKGLSQAIIKDIIAAAFAMRPIYETLPQSIVNEYSLMSRERAVHQIHNPSSTELLYEAQRRLSFEDTLMYMLVVEHRRDERREHSGIAFDTAGIMGKFLKKLPFTPTDAQIKTLKEVEHDLSISVPMNRMIQGDVGSGKTLIAEYALAVAAANGYQGAFMVPTEILARQHYETLSHIFGSTCCLLLGSQTAAERRAVLDRIRSGDCFIAIGTHAILSESVVFDRLGVVITDEQHRFGVAQRAKLSKKGLRPDTLVMSATPIPRTLALILYGDLDLSVIDSLPPGRKPIKTRFVSQAKRDDLYAFLENEAQSGNQSYVVCPTIENDEENGLISAKELYHELKKNCRKTEVGLIHGRMSEKEKTAIMQSFKAGETGILVSTTVIEVGIDVENATNIVIENAERFGLATLHQLRGRVGRGQKQSYCFLLSDSTDPARNERLNALISFSDGFKLAEMDMELRGSGDLLGFRQHGERSVNAIGANCSMETIQSALTAAQEILSVPSAVNHDLFMTAVERFNRLEQVADN